MAHFSPKNDFFSHKINHSKSVNIKKRITLTQFIIFAPIYNSKHQINTKQRQKIYIPRIYQNHEYRINKTTQINTLIKIKFHIITNNGIAIVLNMLPNDFQLKPYPF